MHHPSFAAAVPQDEHLAGPEMPVPVRWMPALFQHTRVDARQYRSEVLAQACGERLAAHGHGVEAWLAALRQSPAEAWALATAIESACWGLPELGGLDIPAVVAAWRAGRPQGPDQGGDAPRVWLPACADADWALRLQGWLAAVPPALPWLVTGAADPTAPAVITGASGLRWGMHRVLHEPMAGHFDLIIAPALLAGVLPHVQRRLLAQWARLLAPAAARSADGAGAGGLLWVGGGAARAQALALGWRPAGPGPLMHAPAVPVSSMQAPALPVHTAGHTDAGSHPAPSAMVDSRTLRPSASAPATRAAGVRPAMPAEQLLMALAREALVLRFEPQRRLLPGRAGERVAMAAVLSLPDAAHHRPETAAAWLAARDPAHAVLLSQWALQLACREAGRWARAGTGAAPDLVVPVVAAQLQQPGWAEQLCQTLELASLAPERLTLSLGARSLLEPPASLLRALVELRRLGVRICVARLKAGDALLDRLAQLPVDALKIDARLLARVPGDALAEATVRRIAALGRAQGWQVVADGVDREVQRAWLAALGCAAYQGPLAGAPLKSGAAAAPERR